MTRASKEKGRSKSRPSRTRSGERRESRNASEPRMEPTIMEPEQDNAETIQLVLGCVACLGLGLVVGATFRAAMQDEVAKAMVNGLASSVMGGGNQTTTSDFESGFPDEEKVETTNTDHEGEQHDED